jgi:hypothetical protein
VQGQGGSPPPLATYRCVRVIAVATPAPQPRSDLGDDLQLALQLQAELLQGADGIEAGESTDDSGDGSLAATSPVLASGEAVSPRASSNARYGGGAAAGGGADSQRSAGNATDGSHGLPHSGGADAAGSGTDLPQPGAAADDGCTRCHTSLHEGMLLLCDACDAPWHTYCLQPPLRSVPQGLWLCPSCDARWLQQVPPVTRPAYVAAHQMRLRQARVAAHLQALHGV